MPLCEYHFLSDSRKLNGVRWPDYMRHYSTTEWLPRRNEYSSMYSFPAKLSWYTAYEDGWRNNFTLSAHGRFADAVKHPKGDTAGYQARF